MAQNIIMATLCAEMVERIVRRHSCRNSSRWYMVLY
ncbi:hypothetical protein PG_1678 [Porphyromonas gingivalis W83]|uniref:Uncharacterized protein n=2 Tax=Porphyromonas gingivalis TaxID=837 RepID=Q7MU76_PORGI|nr:hypothetical protein PG_1678 [Porphyromonas gingivalis W83]BAG32951.1 conserved hypothetical protein [Porphyromonas gingivalis ATCC 33277]